MNKIGEILKAEREKKQMSIHEIATSLKISPKILKAIEEGDSANLPAKTFLRGFIRSYAQYLRLDVNEILKLFQNEMGTTRPETPKETPKESPEAQNISPNIERTDSQDSGTIENITGSNRLYMAIGGIFLLAVIIFVVKMLNKYQKESEKPRVAVEATALENVNDLKVTTSTTVTLVESTSGLPASDENQLPLSKGSPVVIAADKNAEIATTTTAVLTTTTIPTTTTTGASAVITPSSTTTSTTQPKNTRPVEVIVEALNNVTIRYQSGDGKWESIDLTADQVHTFKFKGRIVMEISDGGSVSLIVNGRDRGVPGTIGKMLKLNLP